MTIEMLGMCALTALVAAVVLGVCAVVASIGLCVAVTLYRSVTKGGKGGGSDIPGPGRR